MELVAYLGVDKENWGQVTALINREKWDKIIVVKNKKADDFSKSENVEIINIDVDKPLVELKKDIMEKLKWMIKDFDVALSIASGTGKEHMALIAAILSIPSGIRLVAFTKNGVEYIS